MSVYHLDGDRAELPQIGDDVALRGEVVGQVEGVEVVDGVAVLAVSFNDAGQRIVERMRAIA